MTLTLKFIQAINVKVHLTSHKNPNGEEWLIYFYCKMATIAKIFFFVHCKTAVKKKNVFLQHPHVFLLCACIMITWRCKAKM